MFVCGVCGSLSAPREKAERVVTKFRFVEYPSGGQGWEIVEEVLCHTGCKPLVGPERVK